MQRLLVVLLAALDAAIAAAVGLTVLLAPLTLLWTLALGGDADWGALWPAAGTLWQFGHGVALDITIPQEAAAAVGIPQDAAQFALSLTPLAFAVLTLFSAARSGARAARSGSWVSGVLGGTITFALIATLVASTARTGIAEASFVLGILLPAVIYLVGAKAGAVQYAWREGDEGPIDRLHDVVDSWGDFSAVPGEIVRGAAIVLTLLTGIGALGVAAMVLFRGAEVVALFERAHVDALGATVITLAQLAYLPTVVVWSLSWISGAGFALGTGTAVSPVGTELGVVPGIPILGLIPDGGSVWMLVVILLPIAAGAVAGWMIRSRLVWEDTARDWRPRAAIAVGVPLVVAAAVGVVAVAASGSIGPGRLVEVGPDPWMLALVLGAEVLIGAAILLLSPRHRDEVAEERTDRWTALMGTTPLAADHAIEQARPDPDPGADPEGETVPIDERGLLGRSTDNEA